MIYNNVRGRRALIPTITATQHVNAIRPSIRASATNLYIEGPRNNGELEDSNYDVLNCCC